MGINASKTVVASKEKKEEVKEATKQKKEESLSDSSWRAEKDGRKSSFLQDMLS